MALTGGQKTFLHPPALSEARAESAGVDSVPGLSQAEMEASRWASPGILSGVETPRNSAK
jgi:hypothetical protein